MTASVRLSFCLWLSSLTVTATLAASGSDLETELLQRERQVWDAVAGGDIDTLRGVLSRDFVCVECFLGDVTREEVLKYLTSLDAVDPETIRLRDPSCYRINDVTGVLSYKLVDPEGNASWHLSVWTKDRKGWRLAIHHQGEDEKFP